MIRNIVDIFSGMKQSTYSEFFVLWTDVEKFRVPIILNRNSVHCLEPVLSERGQLAGYCRLYIKFEPYVINIDNGEAERIAKWLVQ